MRPKKKSILRVPRATRAVGRKRLDIIATWLEAGAPHCVSPQGQRITGLNMGSFSEDTSRPECGTTVCIGGAAAVAFCPPGTPWHSLHSGEMGALLGLRFAQYHPLFFLTRDMQFEHGIQFEDITPAWAARCVRKLIATGEVDWMGTRHG